MEEATPASKVLLFENPLIENEQYQVIINPDGTSTWWLLIYDESGRLFHHELVVPIEVNPYL